jgi:hypothetical protein
LVVCQQRELAERPPVEEKVDPLADRELALGVLALDPFGPSHLPEPLLALAELLGAATQVGAGIDIRGDG